MQGGITVTRKTEKQQLVYINDVLKCINLLNNTRVTLRRLSD